MTASARFDCCSARGRGRSYGHRKQREKSTRSTRERASERVVVVEPTPRTNERSEAAEEPIQLAFLVAARVGPEGRAALLARPGPARLRARAGGRAVGRSVGGWDDRWRAMRGAREREREREREPRESSAEDKRSW
ncbi:hypothetical protein MPTK1_4g15630 [Marchantia polymorpha subsp. ruderalis]|uniref:Uncharacterized protein n=2 Tax=Marchantia polymorpha TaxID=3197 RepID=A0AAF6BA93_MARPO|nr:hypothetical protein MARPO_0054s0028 [Marchantia polymorpha]BBN08927.1 hypothetical protein Mp_4g15630 [Marchantia polymorpha subsp. ruderalis]|eukprot:PTQ37913.1 hypothetical protein MARPO_0054s0028 [Marchantia polymorpha]